MRLRMMSKTTRPFEVRGRAYARPFTEHGAIQEANVLTSPCTVTMGIHVVRVFVQLRDLLASHNPLTRSNSAEGSVSRSQQPPQISHRGRKGATRHACNHVRRLTQPAQRRCRSWLTPGPSCHCKTCGLSIRARFRT
jgi:hypothetical protein